MKILSIGTSCVDFYPESGEVKPGGEALNVAVNLSKFEDNEVYLMGSIGTDKNADFLIKIIQKFRINTDHLYNIIGETANNKIYIGNDGDRYFKANSFHNGVRDKFSLSPNDKKLISNMDGVITSIYESNLKDIIKEKNNRKFLLAVDFDTIESFAKWEDMLNGIDIIFSSRKINTLDYMMNMSLKYNALFIATLGEDGSIAFSKGSQFKCPPNQTNEVIDTTGCGDCYIGTFLYQYFKTSNIISSMRAATEESSKILSHFGGFKY